MDLGWFGDADASAAIAYLRDALGVPADRIGLVGMSMGGEEAIGAAAAEPAIAAVVAEGATARVADDKSWLSEAYGWRGAAQEWIEAVQYGLVDLLTAASPPSALRDAVERADRTGFLLIAAGEVDDEQHAADHLRRAAPDRVEVWVVEGADHTDGLDVDPQEWERRVTQFLDEHL
jgi:dienelactone hydrolase